MAIKKLAQDLADAISGSSEYQKLKQARDKIEQHQAAKIMLRDFNRKQVKLQQKQMTGQPITEEDTQELTKLYEVLNINPYIRELLEAELAFHGIMSEVQEILSSAIDLEPIESDELADDLDEDGSDQLEPKLTDRIWTPNN